MLRSFLIGLVAGQRGITPLAVIATATRREEVSAELPLQKLFLNPIIAAGAGTFAAAEMAGDKMKSAPRPYGTDRSGRPQHHRRLCRGRARTA